MTKISKRKSIMKRSSKRSGKRSSKRSSKRSNKRSGSNKRFNDVFEYLKKNTDDVQYLLNDINDRVAYEKEHESWAETMYHQKCDHLLFQLDFNFKVDIDKVKKKYNYVESQPTKESCKDIINAFQKYDIIKSNGTPQDEFKKN